MVVKSDGSREPFSRSKLRGGLVKACEKRPVPTPRIEAIVDQIEEKLHLREDREMSTQEIGEEVIQLLRELDQVAYVRFASVYRKFEDVDAFMKELKTLLKKHQ